MFDPICGAHGSRNDFRIGERCSIQLFANLLNDIVDLAEIAFRQRDYDPLDAEVFEDLNMLFGLRHPTVVSRDHEQRKIDRADASDHVANEIFVTGNVDDSRVKSFAVRAAQS